jgi:preprotein translocase SecE subunit
MAQAPSGRRKPRVRKSAPTIRQQVEAAQEEATKPKSSRWPTKKSDKKSSNRVWAFVKRVFRPLKRPLKWLVPRYFVNSWREVRKVTWPNRKETWRLTLAVFVFAIVFGALVAIVDKGLDEFFKKVILK